MILPVLIWVIAIIFTLNKGNIMNYAPFHSLNLDLVIVFIVYLFVFKGQTSAGVFAFGLGIITDILSGGILGLFTIIYLIIFLSINIISRPLDLLSSGGQIAVIFTAVLLKEFLIFLLLNLFAMENYLSFSDLVWIVISAISTGVISPFFFYVINYLKNIFVEEDNLI